MNLLRIIKEDVSGRNYKAFFLLGLMILIWPMLQRFVMGSDSTIGYIDPNIWLLILLSLICFLMVTGLSWWLLQQFWMNLGLPSTGDMVLQFKHLSLWHQLKLYLLCFALLLLAAVGVLTAIV